MYIYRGRREYRIKDVCMELYKWVDVWTYDFINYSTFDPVRILADDDDA